MPTNNERAGRASEVLEMYAVRFGDPHDPSANLTDVLTDLMHLADKEPELGLKFHSSLKWPNFILRLRQRNAWIIDELKAEEKILST